MYQTYADTFRPSHAQRALLYDSLLVVLGSLFIALTAQISFNIGPVPITGQTLGVLLVAALFGSRRAVVTVVAYLAEGTMGLPFFAGGTAGPAVLVGPTAGYLAGFVAAAFVVGYLAERGWDRTFGRTALAMLLGNAVIYIFGLPWLANFVGVDQVIALGFLPFLPGDVIKLLLAALLLPAGWKLLDR